jgi:hypothetical protein
MKPYLATTGLLFAAVAITHTYRAISRGHVHHLELLLVAASAGLTIWAVRLLKSSAA